MIFNTAIIRAQQSSSSDQVRDFLLDASRPDYDINTDIIDAKVFSSDISGSGNSDFTTLNLDINYGLSRSFILSAGIDILNSQYNYKDVRKSGVGDAFLSLRYHKDVNKYLSIISDVYTKLPIASTKKDLGTGKPDLYFGLALISDAGVFGIQSTFSVGLLSKQPFPSSADSTVFPALQNAINSYKADYDYNIEPVFSVDLCPNIDLSDNVNLYAGLDYARNTRLNFNTATFYSGISYTIIKALNLNAGFNAGVLNYTDSSFNVGLTFYKKH